METTLDELLSALPRVDDTPALVSDPPSGVSYIDIERPEFVRPTVTAGALPAAEAQVVVVTAPAAVGKTMLAEYLALRTRGVLWNLSHFHVGDNFVVGTLARSHGPPALADVLRRLADGTFLVISDAIDEARLRVSFDAFAAFLEDVANQVGATSTPGRPSFVLLARGETADFTADWLRESGVAVANYRIEFFERDRALEFIDKQLSTRALDPHGAPLIQLRDILMEQILDVLGSPPEWDDRARRFLGYAPVLVAVSRYLAQGQEGNPYALVQQLDIDGTPDAIWRFLVALLDNILEREQAKFVSGFRARVAERLRDAPVDDWSAVFQPNEQCAWLARIKIAGSDPPVAVPRPLEDDYRAQVREWLPEHPFIGASPTEFAAPAFEEFVYGRIFASGGAADRERARARVTAHSYQPTEMLARFALASMSSRADQSVEIETADLAPYYESLASVEGAALRPLLVVTDAGRLTATVETESGPVVLVLRNGRQPLAFARRLMHATIILDEHDVRLGTPGTSFEIGPNVSIRAREIQVACESLVVRTPEGEDAGAVLSVQRIVALEPVLQIRGLPRDRVLLEVVAREQPAYPFSGYSVRPEEATDLADEEREAARALFRLLAHFKSEGYGDLGSYAEPIERLASQSQSFADLLQFAKSRGLVTSAGRILKLHPEVIQMNYLQAKAHVISPSVAAFIREFVRSP